MCNEPVVDVSQLPLELQDKVYRPGAGEEYNVELTQAEIFKGEVQVVDDEPEDTDEPD